MFIKGILRKNHDSFAASDPICFNWNSPQSLDTLPLRNCASVDVDFLRKNIHINNFERFVNTSIPHKLTWHSVDSVTVDQAPLFLSCSVLNEQSHYLIGITSLEKNRFSELVNFNMESKLWSSCSRTRHFRPPKRVGTAAVWTEDSIFVFGGYELSNKTILPHPMTSTSSSSSSQNGCCVSELTKDISCYPSDQQIRHNYSSLKLFGYPEWWFNRLLPLQYRDKTTTTMLINTLGDFHVYNLCCGEWNALISRDNKTFLEMSNQSSMSSKASRSFGTHCCMMSRLHRAKYQLRSTSSRALISQPSTKTSLPPPRAYHTLVRDEDNLILFGGECGDIREKTLTTTSTTSSSSQHAEGEDQDESSLRFIPISQLNDVWIFSMKLMEWRIVSPKTIGTPHSVDPSYNIHHDSMKASIAQNYFHAVDSDHALASGSTADHLGSSTVPSTSYLQPSTLQSFNVLYTENDNALTSFSPCRAIPRLMNFQGNYCKDPMRYKGVYLSAEGQRKKNHIDYSVRLSETIKDEEMHFPSPRSGHCAMVYNKVMYIYGGQNNTQILGDFWAFNLETFQWKQLKTTGQSPGPRTGHTAIVVGSEAWIYGGFSDIDIETKMKITCWDCPSSSEYFHPSSSGNDLSYVFSSQTLNHSTHLNQIFDEEEKTQVDPNKTGASTSGDLLFMSLLKPEKKHPWFEFSDGHAVYCLNFDLFHWTKYECQGNPPKDARFFGRLHGFHYMGSLYFGGTAGEKLEFQLSRIDLREIQSHWHNPAVMTERDEKKDEKHLPCQTLSCRTTSQSNFDNFLEIFSNYDSQKPILQIDELDWVLNENFKISVHSDLLDRLSQGSLYSASFPVFTKKTYTDFGQASRSSTHPGTWDLEEFNTKKYFDVEFPCDDMTTTAATSTDDNKPEFQFEDCFCMNDRVVPLLDSLLSDYPAYSSFH